MVGTNADADGGCRVALVDVSSQESAPMPGNTPEPGRSPATNSAPATGSAPTTGSAAPPERDSQRVADAVVVRHAPRFAAFVRAGVLVGAVLGVLGATIVPAPSDSPRAAVIALTALALAVLGAIVGAGLAVLADRRSQRRVDRLDADDPTP